MFFFFSPEYDEILSEVIFIYLFCNCQISYSPVSTMNLEIMNSELVNQVLQVICYFFHQKFHGHLER